LNVFLFTTFGISYTIFSEIKSITIKDLWGYSDLMPVIPFIGVGVVPLIQWIVIPPLIVFFVRRQLS
jgi:Na+/serine symporter